MHGTVHPHPQAPLAPFSVLTAHPNTHLTIPSTCPHGHNLGGMRSKLLRHIQFVRTGNTAPPQAEIGFLKKNEDQRQSKLPLHLRRGNKNVSNDYIWKQKQQNRFMETEGKKPKTVVAQVSAEQNIRANKTSITLPSMWLFALVHLISKKYVQENTKVTLGSYRYNSHSGAKPRYSCKGKSLICKTTETASHLQNFNNSCKAFF